MRTARTRPRTQVLHSLDSQSLGVAVVRTCGALLSARHGAERLSNAWHGGALSMEQVRARSVVRGGMSLGVVCVHV